MDFSRLSSKLADELRSRGWRVDTKQQKCPNGDCHHTQNVSPHKSYCAYCGTELEGAPGAATDLEEALREAGLQAAGLEGALSEAENRVIQVSIPAVVDPKGRVNAMYWQDSEGENRTDEALLYDHWTGKEDVPLRKIRIQAEIDLGAVFESAMFDGTVTDTEDPE